MQRVVVIGNISGGKSTLARRLAARHGLPWQELDKICFRPGWRLVPADEYLAKHGALIAGERWVIEGLGTPDSAPARFQRSTDIIFVDLPLWVHFWFATERQQAWHAGRLGHPPAGEAKAPPTRAVFEAIWVIERGWMPKIRASVRAAERDGYRVTRLVSLEALDAFTASIDT